MGWGGGNVGLGSVDLQEKVVLFDTQPAWQASEGEGEGVKRASAKKNERTRHARGEAVVNLSLPLPCLARSFFFFALAHFISSPSPLDACHAGYLTHLWIAFTLCLHQYPYKCCDHDDKDSVYIILNPQVLVSKNCQLSQVHSGLIFSRCEGNETGLRNAAEKKAQHMKEQKIHFDSTRH